MKKTAKDMLREKGGHMVTISSDATVYQALTVMTQNKVGSIIVLDEEKIVGIWTERDLMFRVLEVGFDAKTARLRDNMSEHLVSANVNDPVYKLYDKFLGKRIRHLLIEDGGDYIGLLSVGDVMKASLQEMHEELAELHNMVSLEYYENWKEVKSRR